MKTAFQMSEESMQRMEARIPELAGAAVKRAYLQALTTQGKVVEARDGQLIETTVEGEVRVLRSIAKPITVTVGAKRFRTLQGTTLTPLVPAPTPTTAAAANTR